jgi:hypothetical protein
MNSRERIMSAIALKQPDRVPFADYTEDLMRSMLLGREHFTEMEFAKAIGFDAININDFVSPVFCKRKVLNGQSYIVDGLIKSDKDLDLMEFPDPTDESLYDDAKRFVENNSDEGLAIYAVMRFGISGVNYSMGVDGLSYALYENPALIDKVLDRYVEWNCEVVERINKMGIDFILSYDNIAYNSGPLVSPQVFREVFVPKIKQIDSLCKIPWITHMDGNIMPIIEDVLDMGVSGIHPIEPGCMDIKEVKALYGSRVCLWGNIDLRYTLTRGTPEEVDAEVKQRISEAGSEGGYILGSGNGLPEYCKTVNVWAMAEAVKKYGSYPLQYL